MRFCALPARLCALRRLPASRPRAVRRRWPGLLAVGLVLLVGCLHAPVAVHAQQRSMLAQRSGVAPRGPVTLTVRTVRVEGVDDPRTRDYVRQTSGLARGLEIRLPGGEALAEAIRSVYRMRLFSDVHILEENRRNGEVDLVIVVTPEPRLVDYTFEGIKGRHEDDIEEQMPLLKGRPVRISDLERAKQVIRTFYAEKGYLRTEVRVRRTPTDDNGVRLLFDVDRNEKVEVGEIRFDGNRAFSDRKLRGAMDDTREDRWWRFWKGEKFKEDAYEEDLQRVVDFYRSEGYYDAHVVRDSVYFLDDDELAVDVTVREGRRYYVRNIDWEGNTVYPDAALTQSLGLEQGDVFNGTKMEENLLGNRRSSDVTSLYLDRGYMRFNAQPMIRVVGEDSLDITFDVTEGDTYTFGDIRIAGNTKTKDHVIRRELYTLPGQTFSRSAIQESIRRLMQLGYFSQESLAEGPSIRVDEDEQQVDLGYSVEEVGNDQLELSGTWGQFGLVLQLGFRFNNFSAQNVFEPSAWRPLPSGDGQKLGLNIRTNGSFFQSYSVSFTEPWFRGRPNPVGGSVSFSRYSRLPTRSTRASTRGDGVLTQISSQVFYERRLKWPDDKFSLSTSLNYQFYDNAGGQNRLLFGLPAGVSQQVSVRQALTRNSLDDPLFPKSGTRVALSVEVAPPLRDLVQYHKWRLRTNWNVPMGENFSFGFTTDYGFVGSITGERVEFERFDVGGSPFDWAGFNIGVDPVLMRGYPQSAIGPRGTFERGGRTVQEAVGGTVLTKYTSEVRWHAMNSSQLRLQPYAFFDAANAWERFETMQPTDLFRSAGFGARLFLPIVGMLEVNYGRNLDAFSPLGTGQSSGASDWRFQFALGQSFGGN